MSYNSLQQILSYTETLDLPEGEYLHIANGLKSIFENSTTYAAPNTYIVENDTLLLTLTQCTNNTTITTKVKSITANNIENDGPVKFIINIETTIKHTHRMPDTNIPDNIIEYSIKYPNKHNRYNFLDVLFEMYTPRNVYMKMNNLEIDYECYSFIDDWKKRRDTEFSINSSDPVNYTVSDDTFNTIMKSRFITLCREWFWDKYYTLHAS